jgi:general secretion pathway protein D
MYFGKLFSTCIIAFLAFQLQIFSQGQSDEGSDTLPLPRQSPPGIEPIANNETDLVRVDEQTNLVDLLAEIRKLVKEENFIRAENIANAALTKIALTDQNKFYLQQIRKEETKIFYQQAQLAFKNKNYSLASQLLERYRENVTLEISERKIQRESLKATTSSKDASLVGRLVEELDKAKKDLAEIRAKSGLPADDAKPDLERLMEQEKKKVEDTTRIAESLLIQAQRNGAKGEYELAMEQLDEALAVLPSSVSTIALISDLYKSKQQIVWYRMGEAMLKGKVSGVQKLVIDWKDIENSKRNAETETLGVGDEIDFDAEIAKANQKNKEQAELASEMIDDARDLISEKDYQKADDILYKIKNFLEPSTLTWPIILEAALIKNRIHLEKSEDAREAKNWDAAQKHLDDFKTGYYQDRDIQGDTLTYGRPGLKESRGEEAATDELELAEKMAKKIKDDKLDPYRRDITEYTPDWKESQAQLQDMLMRAKVQFINGDLTGATETYRTVETKYSDNFEAKEMLKRISMMRQQESYLGYLKTRQEMLEEIEREWERPKVFDRQIEETQEAQSEATDLENKLDLIKIPSVPFFESPLDEVMQELMRQAKQFDLTESDPAKKGVQIIVLKPEGEELPPVTITLQSLELGKMIQFITEMVGWTYDIRADAVVISKTGGSFKGRPMETEFYEVPQATINRMTGGSGGGGGAAADPFAPPPMAGAGGDDDTGLKIKAFLEGAGIPFDDAKGHKFVFDGVSQIIVTHDRRSLDFIERILAKMDGEAGIQVEIETKFLEVQEGALDEISFDWKYAFGNPTYEINPATGAPVLDTRGNPKVLYENTYIGNTRTLATAHSPSSVARETTVTYPNNPDNNRAFNSPLPGIPGTSAQLGTGVNPLMEVGTNLLSSGTSVLPNVQATVLVNALKRKQGTDLLSAPRVTVMNGTQATITIAQEFIYPTDYQPAPQTTGGGGGVLGGGGGQPIQIQPATPSFDTVAPDDEQPGFREVGVVLNVTPTVQKYNQIHLQLNPKVTEFDGFIEYGGSSVSLSSSSFGPTVISPSGILMPIFSVRKVLTEVTVFDGATVIIGGLTREEVKTVNDKIPVLGNIPLLGRLFQSSAESYQKRNLLIFVSANIVSAGGSPVRETIQSITPQSIFKDPVILTPTGTIRRSFKTAEDAGN